MPAIDAVAHRYRLPEVTSVAQVFRWNAIVRTTSGAWPNHMCSFRCKRKAQSECKLLKAFFKC